MNQQAKRIKELFGYARTLTKEQGIGTMCVRAAGFFKRRFFGKRARYWPSNMALEAQRSDPAAETFPIISILTPLYNTPQNFLTEFLDSVENQTAHNWQLCLADASDDAHTYVGELVQKHVAANPRILLMDEPFGAVDEITRRSLQKEILRLQRDLGITVVFVTHDIKEALHLGSRVLVMEAGRISQLGTPEQIKTAPADAFVRELIFGQEE